MKKGAKHELYKIETFYKVHEKVINWLDDYFSMLC